MCVFVCVLCVCVSTLKYEIGSLQQKTAGKQCLDTKESVRKIIATASLGVQHEIYTNPLKVWVWKGVF